MKTILAAIDFSPISRRVVAEAVRLGRAVNAQIVILNAVRVPALVAELAPLAGEALQFTAEVERAARVQLRRWQKRLASRGVQAETVCEQGFPVAVIMAHAEKRDASYLVIGSHGHSAFRGLVAGSTASAVLKKATRPVVVVPASRERKRRSR